MSLEDARLALTLLAIEPGLKGALLAGPPGTGKSALARAARSLWPAKAPFVALPLGVTLDRLVGGIDMERTLAAGHPVASAGLLAAAHGGVLYVDEINLLEPGVANVLLQALATGQVQLEREGLSRSYPADFVLIGTFNPAEGPVSPALLERIAFLIPVSTVRDVPTRARIAAAGGQPITLAPDVVHMAEVGREVLPLVRPPRNVLKELCAAATAMQVPGNRAEIFALRCTKANAALNARVPITQSDIDLAVRLVLAPRATHHLQIASEGAADRPPAEAAPAPRRQSAEGQVEQPGNSPASQVAGMPPTPEEQGAAPPALLREPLRAEGGTAPGRRGRGLNFRRGRHIRSVAGKPGRGQLALLDTLKSAAARGRPVSIRREDIRIKQFRQRTGLLVILAVDASGSMALNRINAARGAAIGLLQSAYVHRDRIALLAFRGEGAEVILSPGGGVAKARRALEALPTGGRTPLSAALARALALSGEEACRLHVAGTVLVIITDARANQPLRPAPQDGDRREQARTEVARLAQQLRPLLAGSVVVDTRRFFVPDGSAQELAGWLGASYVYLPRLSAGQVTSAVRAELARLR